jgi:hypothetical protein
MVEGYEPTYTDMNVAAVYAWHNLAIIQKGANREGSSRDRIAHLKKA